MNETTHCILIIVLIRQRYRDKPEFVTKILEIYSFTIHESVVTPNVAALTFTVKSVTVDICYVESDIIIV